jgi:outer membrane protein assembly factor BamB
MPRDLESQRSKTVQRDWEEFAGGGARTHTILRSLDFESAVVQRKALTSVSLKRQKESMKLVALIIAASIVLIATSLPAATPNWNSYLHDAKHSSFNAGTATFTPTASASIVANWTFPPPTAATLSANAFVASPTVSNGVVYIGSITGVFYAVDESSGTELWHRDLGVTPQSPCASGAIKGISSTAAVASDSSRGGQLTVYVGGGNGFLYALRASDGKVVWKKPVVDVNGDGYNWASPTVTGGHVYMGISSNCDNPLIRGGIKDFDQATGALMRTYWSVAQGSVGGSVWTSPASDGTSVWATIGNGDSGDSFAIVRLDVATLTLQDRWVVPNTAGTDLDWGSSPTLFDATLNGTLTTMVGAASKNGKFYAFKANDLASGPVWSRKLGAPGGELKTKGLLLAAAIWDFKDHRLFVGSNTTTISGMTAAGSVRELNPSTGQVIWPRALSGGPVMGSPSMNAGGVIAAGTYNTVTFSANRVYLLDASDGSVVHTIQEDAPVFAQPVFADTHLFVATTAGVLTAYSVAP